MNKDGLGVSVRGHLRAVDDLGNVLLDKDNAVHPQNMARVIARALSNESNYFVHRIAFGNGGTVVDAAHTITYNTPNDGQGGDSANTWRSRLYNETYSEIINEGNVSVNALLGTDPGSASSGNERPGGGANPAGDPASIPHVSGPGVRSNELGLTSEIVITAVLNPGEPMGQLGTDQGTANPADPLAQTESSFWFDEIGLFTSGAPLIATSGYQYIDVGNRVSTDPTGLLPNTAYSFSIAVDGGSAVSVSFTTPAGGTGANGEITYGDLCEAINTGDTGWNPLWNGVSPLPVVATVPTKISITDYSGAYSTIANAQTYGYLMFESPTTGALSAVDASGAMFAALNPPTGGVILTAVAGKSAGVQNMPTDPTTEGERMLTHVIFAPVLKSANRTLTITYTITVSVARTVY
jgi:hypothetical protein